MFEQYFSYHQGTNRQTNKRQTEKTEKSGQTNKGQTEKQRKTDKQTKDKLKKTEKNIQTNIQIDRQANS
jgi:hypothetical protein